jgi:hypothetical protein
MAVQADLPRGGCMKYPDGGGLDVAERGPPGAGHPWSGQGAFVGCRARIGP